MFVCTDTLPDHTSLLCCKALHQWISLYFSWASTEPLIYGDALIWLTQLDYMSLHLPDFSRLQQLPPHVTALSLRTRKLLDMAMAPCLQSCSGLQCLMQVCTDMLLL